MDNIKPQELVSDLVRAGAYKSGLAAKDILIRSFLAGALLSFAVVLALTSSLQTGLGIVGALVFPVGFVMIVLLGLELVTGNFALMPMALLGKQTQINHVLRNWAYSFVGNLLGSVFFGGLFFIYVTECGNQFESPIIQKIVSLGEQKTLFYKNLGVSGFVVAFTKGILCNWLVTMGVVMGMASSSTVGKIVGAWLPIFMFFAIGLEHCVVNMFVVPVAMMFGASISTWDWWIWNQIPVTLGNLLGGALLTGISLYATHYSPKIQN